MLNVPEDLRERVERLNADLALGLVRGDEAVWLACDLLVAGSGTPALAELAGESPKHVSWVEVVPLVRQALAELGVEPLAESRAAWVLVRHIAGQVIAGVVPANEGAHALWGLWWSCETIPEIGALVIPLDMWDRSQDHEAIRGLCEDVLRVAEERLR